MEVRAARASERDEVLDLLALWYNDRAFFARYNRKDPAFRDELCLVASDRGQLVSTVQIFDRAINLEGQCVPMGGIGSVFTREDYRHKGVASALMRLSVETMAREGFEVSLLFAERLTFYNQFGWREVDRKFSVLGDAAQLAGAADDVVIDAFDAAQDLAEVTALHRAYSGHFNVTAVRDQACWRGNLLYAGNQPMHVGEDAEEYFVLARRRGRIDAYARVTRFYGVAMVMEYGYLPGAEPAMLALFKHLGEMAAGKPPTFRLEGDHYRSALLRIDFNVAAPGALVTHTAHDPGLEQALAAGGSPVAHHHDNNYMWRIIAPDRLARRFGTSPDAATERAFALFSDSRSLFWTADRF
jgi:predicted N-acetyltransferase YhbS